jgi:O-antigen ligase
MTTAGPTGLRGDGDSRVSDLLTLRDAQLLIAALTPLVALLALVLTLYRPRAALAACCAVFLLAGTKFRMRDPQALVGGDIDGQVMFELVLFSAVILIALRNALRLRPALLRPGGTELLLSGYVGLALASVIWATYVNITAVRAVQLAILLLFAVVAVRILTPQRLLKVLLASVVSYVLILSGLVFMFPHGAGGPHWTSPRPRFCWFAEHPLTAATHAGSALILLLAFTLFDPARRKDSPLRQMPTWLMIGILAGVLLLTRSRAALLATTAATLILFVRAFIIGAHAVRTKLSMAFVLLWTGLVSGMLLQQLGRPDPTQSRLGGFFMRGQTLDELATLSSRDLIWKEVLVLFAEQPLVGYGYLGSRVLLLDKISWAGDGHFHLAESLMNLGGVGTALIFLPIVFLLLSSSFFLFRSDGPDVKYRAAIAAGTIFLLLNGMSTPGFAGPPTYEVLLFFILAVVNQHLPLPGARLAPRAAAPGTVPWAPPAGGFSPGARLGAAPP